ncbi:imidazolonepropionase [Caballeronia mineralivorans]|jgi:imidazolonepropionase|uniref:imidazolonepropionase n=1 Tax=Caballeronia mineralivorans TaxID=2010198 RepID=UPI0023F566DD|nr:imidazolonepropionase [Caballeronia mineralivorans]MDB5783753.1 imidazolonepropionase [Caballeronia mineralivorans]MEA3101449.1 imidazolonepropionase [Caballeronia mineralivorans]
MTDNSLHIWGNARLAPRADPVDVLENAAIVVRDGRIEWFGAEGDMPSAFAGATRHDLEGRIVTPGLVDCHTHLVYAGNRAEEFAMRLEGVSYEDIAKRGGGIVSTVRNTRAASEDELFAQSLRRLDALLAEGVTALEIKSGYGLDLATERKMLRVARRLAAARPVTIATTLLGAHALPPEYAGRADDYIAQVCNEMLPTLAGEGLIDAVDVFCERIAFTLEQAECVFDAASKLNLPVKMHAEQLSLMGGAALAAKHHALSADHLEFLDEAGIIAMREAGTVAVLLPGAFYFIREKQLPPIDLLRRHGVPIALATDSNPGTSPTTSLLLMLNMGCTLFRLSVAEVLAGVTRHGAKALGHADVSGEITIGAKADFVAWDIETLAELAYWSGLERCALVVRHGAVTVDKRK